MSEAPTGEKVFPASERKRKDARKKGQVARSMELGAVTVLITILAWLRFSLTSGETVNDLFSSFQEAFQFNPHPNAMTLETTGAILQNATVWALRLMLPGLCVAMVAGLVANVAQVGLDFSGEALMPKWDKINPMSGLKRLFLATA